LIIMDTLNLAQGTSGSWTVTVCDADGTPIAYAGTETLTARVWAGGGQPTLFTPTVAWSLASAGQLSLKIVASATAAVEPGQYRLLVSLTDGTGATYDAYEAILNVTWAPGSAPSRPQYITIDDLRKVFPQVEDLQDPSQQQAGFADQLADAREWLDECILRNYRGGNISLLGYHGLALDAWYTGGVRRTSLTNVWLRDQLKANTLILSGRIKRVLALYAAYLVCLSSLSKGKQYQALAAQFLHQAQSLLVCTTAELCLDGSGTPHVPINLSTTNTLNG
jgi:hypothetical protein